MSVIGNLSARSPRVTGHLVQAFRRGLSEAGFVEGQNVMVEYRWALGQHDRLPGLAADLVRKSVAVVVSTGGESAALAAKRETSTIPIAFITSCDGRRAQGHQPLDVQLADLSAFDPSGLWNNCQNFGWKQQDQVGPVVLDSNQNYKAERRIVALGLTGTGVTTSGPLAKTSTPPVTRRIFFGKQNNGSRETLPRATTASCLR